MSIYFQNTWGYNFLSGNEDISKQKCMELWALFRVYDIQPEFCLDINSSRDLPRQKKEGKSLDPKSNQFQLQTNYFLDHQLLQDGLINSFIKSKKASSLMGCG